jgi:hypothetical protein
MTNPFSDTQRKNWGYWLRALLHHFTQTPTRAFAVFVLPVTVVLALALLHRVYPGQSIPVGPMLTMLSLLLLLLYSGFVVVLRLLRMLRFLVGIVLERRRVSTQAARAKHRHIKQRARNALNANRW